MDQLGHTDPAFTLRLYSHAMGRDDGERDRFAALVGRSDWAPMGANAVRTVSVPNGNPMVGRVETAI
jgi:hypothetical protein